MTLSENQKFVFDFFNGFSQLEHILKYHHCNGDYCFLKTEREDKAAVDWSSLAKKLEMHGCNIPKNISVLIKAPPKIQIVQNGSPNWKSCISHGREIKWSHVLEYVRRVRNNQFHGVKDIEGDSDDANRNRALIKEAKEIIYFLLQQIKDGRLCAHS